MHVVLFKITLCLVNMILIWKGWWLLLAVLNFKSFGRITKGQNSQGTENEL